MARWTFDHARKLVEIVLVNDTGPEETERFFDEFEAANAISYRKLVDATKAIARIDDRVMAIVSARLARYKAMNPGPVAVVVHSVYFDSLAKLFLLAVDAERNARVFRTVPEARDWLGAIATQMTQR